MEKETTQLILRKYLEDLLERMEPDVCVVGAGPSGMCCAYYLARNGRSVLLLERSSSIGGGMWGGGMMFPWIVIEEDAAEVARELGIELEKHDKLYVANAVQAVCAMGLKCHAAGARILNFISVEDVIFRENRVCGVVVNWTAALKAGMHVDPLSIPSKFVVDATGHECGICRIVEKRVGRLETGSGGVIGEKAMWAEAGERDIVSNTKEIYPGVVVAGMAANAVCGSPRMGPIFGGMLLSGKKAAELILGKI